MQETKIWAVRDRVSSKMMLRFLADREVEMASSPVMVAGAGGRARFLEWRGGIWFCCHLTLADFEASNFSNACLMPLQRFRIGRFITWEKQLGIICVDRPSQLFIQRR